MAKHNKVKSSRRKIEICAHPEDLISGWLEAGNGPPACVVMLLTPSCSRPIRRLAKRRGTKGNWMRSLIFLYFLQTDTREQDAWLLGIFASPGADRDMGSAQGWLRQSEGASRILAMGIENRITQRATQ